MTQKRKKETLVLKHLPLPKVSTLLSPEPERDMFLDNLARLVGNFGFQQIFLPSIEERRMFFEKPQLQKHFSSEQLLEINAPGGLEFALNPAYFLSLFKKYLQNRESRGAHVAKWFYLVPIAEFSADRAVARHELGIFILGEDSALANAQLINTVIQILGEAGVLEVVTEINSMGCKNCRKDYQNVLQEHLRSGSFNLCANCLSDLEDNPLSVWSCGETSCQTLLTSAPQIVDFLDESCRSALVGVLEAIDEFSIPYTLNPAFWWSYAEENVLFQILGAGGKQTLIGQGGNYSPWSQYLGNEERVPLIGFLTSFERLWPLVPEEKRKIVNKTEVFLIPLGEVAARKVLLLQRELQRSGVRAAETILQSGGIKNQLKEAGERNSDIALIIGQKEALDETVILRDIRSGMQEVFAHDRIIEEVKKRLGK